MVSYRRSKLLYDLGLKNIHDVANADIAKLSVNIMKRNSKDTSLPTVFPLIKNYARAICNRRPIVTGVHDIFHQYSRKVNFIDLEYDPEGTKSKKRFGIFLCGILDSQGCVTQYFLDDAREEKVLVEQLLDWIQKNRSILVTYASRCADEPHLRNSLKKFGLPIEDLSNTRFLDLYYEVIFTQSPLIQKIFLPIQGSISSKKVASYFHYREPPNLKIHDGLEALLTYRQYIKKRSKTIRKNLLAYNRCDLERTAQIYRRLQQLSAQHQNKRTNSLSR